MTCYNLYEIRDALEFSKLDSIIKIRRGIAVQRLRVNAKVVTSIPIRGKNLCNRVLFG